MPAFLIADIEVTDENTYSIYRKANPDIVNRMYELMRKDAEGEIPI